MADNPKERNLRVMYWGFGLMNQITLGMMLSVRPLGTCDIVAVADRNAARKGKKVGDILRANPTVRDDILVQPRGSETLVTEIPKEIDEMIVQDPADIENIIATCKPDVCMLATRAFIKEIEDQLRICIKHGVDVMTIAEEALFPHECEVPEVVAKLEEEAKAKGVRIVGTGFNDSGWIILALTGGSMMLNMTKIVASISWDARDYGTSVNEYIGVAMTPEQFQKELVEPAETAPSVDSPAVYSIARGLGLTPIGSSLRHEFRAILAKTRMFSEALKKWVEPGNVKGQYVACILDTEEGVQVVAESNGYIFGEEGSTEDEEEDMKVTMTGGVPASMVIRSTDVKGRLLTCTPMINRLPQLLTAPAGFVTPDMLPPPPYLGKGFPKVAKA